MALEVADHWYETDHYPDGVTRIREAHVQPDLRCNIWHVRGRLCDLLVDSGLGLVPLRPTIAALSGHEVLAVASHTHFDHVGGHHEFEHRLCHPAEAAVLTQPTAENTVWQAYRPMVDEDRAVAALPFTGFGFDAYRVLPAPPSRLIDEGDEIDLGDRHFKVFHMPGHSPGSVCLFETATATLFTGDVLYDGELLDSLFHSDRDIYLETLARLREIPAGTFHCGHFESFGKRRMIELIDHYQLLRSQAGTA
jgi:glyoxylase-like metal-dependent hydrolase (beta-lactamase superfamily II)